jgi:dihydrodipicolinate synthase/N-acetylneuraminate lyase
MPLSIHELDAQVLGSIRAGLAIPAHPLALDANRQLDVRRQRALTRYYCDAGVGGLAVGVHTTQFAIREVGLYEPVLQLAAETASAHTDRSLAMIAGLAGRPEQAVKEADIAVGLGYHAGLLSLGAMRDASEDEIIEHCRAVAQRIPLFGFYLQPAVGGRHLPGSFWKRFCEIDNVIAIKMAPFNRYRTIDVVQGLVDARAEDRVTLYTGNDDHIVLDLLLPFSVKRGGEGVTVRIKGGLLGHWSVWTRSSVQLFEKCKAAVQSGGVLSPELLALDSRVTAMNAAVFDVENDFHGCIAGCHDILRRQGLLEGIWCLDPAEGLGRGQSEALDRAIADNPDLIDDAFVAANLGRWLDGN